VIMTSDITEFEAERYEGVVIAGVDEAGRGPLAGPVIAAAVILHPDRPIEGLADSKKISEKKRAHLEIVIKEQAWAWALGRAEVHEIDDINILHASMLAMKRAVEALMHEPEHVLVDGNRCPHISLSVEAIVKGDQKVAAISAASILAKQARDREMLELHEQYPHYNFAQHKGYPTRMHMEALQQHGASPIHRTTFGPVRKVL
jgi:ribonuclease HII